MELVRATYPDAAGFTNSFVSQTYSKAPRTVAEKRVLDSTESEASGVRL